MEVEIDGKLYHTTEPSELPPSLLREEEKEAVDATLRAMAKKVRRQSIDARRYLDPKHGWSREALDRVILDSLVSLKIDVKDEPAEKLFDRLFEVIASGSDDWDDDIDALNVLFCRYLSTIQALISYKGRFRGKEVDDPTYTKEEALAILRERGLAR